MASVIRKAVIEIPGIKKKLHLTYDSRLDVLYASINKSEPAEAEQIADGVWFRHSLKTGKLVGVTIESMSRIEKSAKKYKKQLEEKEHDLEVAGQIIGNGTVKELVEA